jgi:hypothetical protein
VIRASSEVDNQATENKASNEGNYAKSKKSQHHQQTRKKRTLNDGEDKLG